MRSAIGPKLSRAAGLAILSFVTIFPLYTIVISSIKPLGDVRSTFHWIPTHVTFKPYVDIWKTIPLAHYFLNSLIVLVCATACSVVIAIFAAYAVSRYRFRGHRVFTLTVTVQATLVPRLPLAPSFARALRDGALAPT